MLGNKKIIISSKTGYLGNRLFLFAQFIAFALENNLEIWNPAFYNYAKYFKNLNNNLLSKFPYVKKNYLFLSLIRKVIYLFFRMCFILADRFKINIKNVSFVKKNGIIKQVGEYHLDSREFIEKVEKSKRILVSGWLFRYSKGVNKYQDQIREFLRPRDKYIYQAKEFIKKIHNQTDLVIGVHIRHGDFRGGKYFLEIEEYLEISPIYQ